MPRTHNPEERRTPTPHPAFRDLDAKESDRVAIAILHVPTEHVTSFLDGLTLGTTIERARHDTPGVKINPVGVYVCARCGRVALQGTCPCQSKTT